MNPIILMFCCFCGVIVVYMTKPAIDAFIKRSIAGILTRKIIKFRNKK